MANVDLNILFKEGRQLWFYQNVIKMLQVLSDDQFAVFGGRVFEQTVGISMGTNCVPLRRLLLFVWGRFHTGYSIEKLN